MAARFGAFPEEWNHLDLVLGLTEDLLPVVSNPVAEISAQSTLKTLGKTPSVYNKKGKVAGLVSWTDYEATSENIQEWSEEEDYGICIQTRNVRAIDIDVEDPEAVGRIEKCVRSNLANALPPRRYRNASAKCLIAFRLPGEMPKRILRFDGGLIEFLGNGQQFVAYGTHPSGVKYQWNWNDHDDFPEITLVQFEKIWAALAKEFAAVQTNAASRNAVTTPALRIKDAVLDILPIISWGKEGQAFIECPFKVDHSMDSGETETTYFPAGTRGYERGHFHCLHAHCAEKSDTDFLDALGLRAKEFDIIEDPLPAQEKKIFNIKVRTGHFPEAVSQAEEALIAAEFAYYQRGANLVRPVVETLPATKSRTTRMVQLVEVDVPYLTHDLCKAATWLRLDGRIKKWVKSDAPTPIAITLLSNYGHWQFPQINGIISTPTLRPDGSLLYEEGYDTRTGLLLYGMPEMPAIEPRPGRHDAQKALGLLKQLLTEFPFVEKASESVALSALITPVVRGAFSCAPMHIVRAPAPGSGKSFLLDVAAAISLGQACPVLAAGKNEEETEKRLSSALLAGQPIINLDNVNGLLGGDFLCQLIERPIVEVRILGKSQVVKLESRSTVFATGNNISVIGDMTRRIIMCRLDANIERPELREFKDDPVARVLQNRGLYIHAALTIVRAYIEAGRPNKAPNLASFTEWSDTVRSALIWLGEADPVESMEIARGEDPQLQNAVTIFSSMHECINATNPLSAGDIIKIAQRGDGTIGDGESDKYEEFYEALLYALGNFNGKLNSKHLGRWLMRYKDRIVGGLRLHGKVDRGGHAAVWWVTQELT